MSRVRVKLNSSGIRELLKSAEVQAECVMYASQVASRAGAGYVMGTRMYPERSAAIVRPDTIQASMSNKKHNTLLKCL